jgi:hypothetical protein
MNQLRSKLDSFTEIVNRKLEVLADEVYAIKENKPYSILVLEDVNNELKKENIELNSLTTYPNSFVRERLNDRNFISSVQCML